MFFEEMMNSYWNKKSGKKKGFTLVEMMVVVAIIAVLTSIIIPVFKGSTIKAAAATNAANLRAAKGEFTTLKLLYPSDYTAMLGGFNALTGMIAEDEKFEVQGTDQKVSALNAVEVNAGDTFVPKDTPMSAQITRDLETGAEEVYVTYNGLPIAYFAELAEKGYADPDAYRKANGNTAANQAYLQKYTNRVNTMLQGMREKDTLGLLYGNLLNQMQTIIDDPAAQGDCLKCSMNNIDIENSGSTAIGLAETFLGIDVEQMLHNKTGYTHSDTLQLCTVYTPVAGSIACKCGHGPDSHLSTTEAIDMGAGFTECPNGGMHEYTYINHDCKKCGYHLDKPCPSRESGLPFVDSLIDDECTYCGYCPCCAGGKKNYKSVVNYILDTGVCMSSNPLTNKDGDRSGYGCGHTKDQHNANRFK